LSISSYIFYYSETKISFGGFYNTLNA